MNNSFILTLILLSTLTLKSQNTKVIFVKYKMSTYNNDVVRKNENISNKDKEMLNEVKNIFDEIEFNLFIKNDKSIFKITEQLNKSDDYPQHKIFKNILSGGNYYYDKKNKEIINSVEFEGEKFNIIGLNDKYNWQITSEKKIIDGYECIKAICHVESYQKFRDKTISLDPYVWFAPVLAYPFGPKDANGLPGLILEACFNSKTYYYATAINFDHQASNLNFDRPENGKYLSKEEFDAIQIKLINEKMQK